MNMSDNRRYDRSDNRKSWNDSDRRAPRDRDRDRDHDNRRRGGRAYRDGSRDRVGPRHRSRSPDRRYRDRGEDRDRGSGRDRRHDGARRHGDGDWRDRRGDDDRMDRKGHHRDSRSRSPQPSSLPSRPRNTDPKPQLHDHAARSPPRDEKPTPKDRMQGSDVEEPMDELDEDAAAMQAMLGFGGFGTTKGKKVAGNNAGAVKKEKKTEYRQYMNRVGGFNRPLSPSR